jgi:hypothetical protein
MVKAVHVLKMDFIGISLLGKAFPNPRACP